MYVKKIELNRELPMNCYEATIILNINKKYPCILCKLDIGSSPIKKTVYQLINWQCMFDYNTYILGIETDSTIMVSEITREESYVFNHREELQRGLSINHCCMITTTGAPVMFELARIWKQCGVNALLQSYYLEHYEFLKALDDYTKRYKVDFAKYLMLRL